MNKHSKVIGQQVVEERTQLVLEMVQLNKLLGYERYDILMELEKLLSVMNRYGIRDTETLKVLLLMEQ